MSGGDVVGPDVGGLLFHGGVEGEDAVARGGGTHDFQEREAVADHFEFIVDLFGGLAVLLYGCEVAFAEFHT